MTIPPFSPYMRDGTKYSENPWSPEHPERVMNISCAENIYLWDKFKAKYPKSFKALSSLYSDKFSITKRFIACNLINDDVLTFDLNDATINVEDVKCPLRGGFCKWEGVICRCTNQFDISASDIELVKMLKKGCAYTNIAHHFKVSVDAIKKRISRLKKRTGANSRIELINFLYI